VTRLPSANSSAKNYGRWGGQVAPEWTTRKKACLPLTSQEGMAGCEAGQGRGVHGGPSAGRRFTTTKAARGPRSMGSWEGVHPREILAWAFKSPPRGEKYRNQHLLVYISLVLCS